VHRAHPRIDLDARNPGHHYEGRDRVPSSQLYVVLRHLRLPATTLRASKSSPAVVEPQKVSVSILACLLRSRSCRRNPCAETITGVVGRQKRAKSRCFWRITKCAFDSSAALIYLHPQS